MKKEGLKSFYKGLGAALIGTIASSGIYFWWYRFWKNVFFNYLKRKSLSDLDISVITFLAGFINSVITNPIWFINTRMSISKGKKSIF